MRAYLLVVALTSLAAGAASAQTWTAPKLANGQPDLQGTWENNSATPLERPAELADKPLLSEEEVADLQARAARIFGPEADAVFGDALYLALLDDRRSRQTFVTGTYSQNWVPARYFERRTSLIEHPADGKLPPLTAEAVARRAAAFAARPPRARSVRDYALSDRCITYGVPDLFAAYMSVYRIIQTPDHVVIQQEKVHDVRVIPLDGRPHVSPAIRQYLGDPRGRFEGDTLVVETTNFRPGNNMGGYFVYADENLKLTERFTRVADDTLRYEFTIDDPTVWTQPWTAAIYWKRSEGQIYEYACHEGNSTSLRGMLSALRAEEAAGDVPAAR
jgi:hypothetical protein